MLLIGHSRLNRHVCTTRFAEYAISRRRRRNYIVHNVPLQRPRKAKVSTNRCGKSTANSYIKKPLLKLWGLIKRIMLDDTFYPMSGLQ